MADRDAKGRGARRGARKPHLAEQEHAQIATLRAAGMTPREVCGRYGIRVRQIRRIFRRFRIGALALGLLIAAGLLPGTADAKPTPIKFPPQSGATQWLIVYDRSTGEGHIFRFRGPAGERPQFRVRAIELRR